MTDYSNRHKEFFKGVKLPQVYTPEDRGVDECCCDPFFVFGSPDTDSWKRDRTSAWMRDVDAVSFFLEKEDGTIIPLIGVPFPNQLDAQFATVEWSDILATYGRGCYTLKIDYTISGITDSLEWGKYKAEWYSIENKRNMVRLRVRFDSLQTIEGINFKGSEVEDCINFFGFFGKMQPNSVIENIVYGTRETKKVHRENLPTYELSTHYLKECITQKLINLYLLSENDLLVSDHNPGNHTYKYLDWPCIVEETPELTYQFRLAMVKVKLGDKYKNSRSKFGV